MFTKISLAAAAIAATFTALPAAAEARHRDSYYDGGRYEQSYRGDRQYRGDRYRGRSYRDGRRYNDRRYNQYYGRNSRGCSGTTGTIVGAVAGGLLGREIAGRGDRTTGTIIGGALGALGGRAIDKGDCRR